MKPRLAGTALIAVFYLLPAAICVHADTEGNTTVYTATHDIDPTASTCSATGGQCHVVSGWWAGTSLPVNQRYGCTDYTGEPDNAPNFCPSNYRWHQGIDFDTGQASISIYSQVEGSVADYGPKPASSCSLTSTTTLGWLAIRTNGGNVVFLLHGCTTSAFANPGTIVHINDNVYSTGRNGPYSSGWHLHFEVHRSIATSASLLSSAGPGDDINPEGWLFRLPSAYGEQLTSWSAGDLGEFAHGTLDDMYQSDGGPTGPWSSSWTDWSQPSGSGLYEPLRTSPVAISQSPNEFDAFAILQGGDLGWWSYVNGVVCGWLLIPHSPVPALSQGLTVVSPKVGALDVFVQGIDGGIYHWFARDYGNPGCATYSYAWQALGLPTGFPTSPTTFGSDMVAVSSDDNNLFLVARDTTRAVWWTHFDANTWYSWQSLSGPTGNSTGNGIAAVAWRTSDPATGMLTRELDVFARSIDPPHSGTSDLYHARYTCAASNDVCTAGWGSGWMGDVSTQGAFDPSGDFAAVSWAAFRIDIFVRDQHYDNADGWLWHNSLTLNPLTGSPGWSGYSGQNFYAPPNNMLASHLGVVALGYQSIDVTVQASPDRATYRYWHLCYCNNTWNALPTGP